MMKFIRRTLRFLHIYFVVVRYGLDKVLLAIPWLYPLRFLSYLNPWNWGANKGLSRGARIRLILEELGPIYVKFGQVLSTRRDLLPEDVASELAQLQDNVPPFAMSEVERILEQSFAAPMAEIFAEFEPAPRASASIAQVHFAILTNGQEVAVKVLRPGIKSVIRSDLDILYMFAKLIERYWAESRRMHLPEIVTEFEHNLMKELDLLREAANASQLKRNFANYKKLHIPTIYWDYCHHNILVMERIAGIPVTDIDALRAANINMKKLAERGVEIFFTQVFRDCFFHADMHPGNIFVSPEDPEDPVYIAVDFGIMGTLNPDDQRYLAENILAFFKRDYRRVAELHVESGWVPADTRIDEFEADIRTVCEPVIGRPLIEISFARLIIRLFQTAKRFQMQVQPQLALLQKTLFNIEGLGRQLYPELNLWETAKPFLEDWLKQQLGPKAFVKKVYDNGPFWLEKMPQIPDMFYNLLQEKVKQQRLAPLQQREEQQRLAKQEKRKKKYFAFGAGLAFVVYSIVNIIIMPTSTLTNAPSFWLLFSTTTLGILLLFFAYL